MAYQMNLCRACLTTKESFTYALCDNVSADIYCFCTSLEVKQFPALFSSLQLKYLSTYVTLRLRTCSDFKYSPKNVTCFQVHEIEELPKTLCNSCYELLKRYADFKKTCIQSQNTLVELQNSLKPENKAKETDAFFKRDEDSNYYVAVKIEKENNDFHDGTKEFSLE